VDVDLTIIGHPDLGILLFYLKTGAGRGAYYSKGDLTRLREWVKTAHDDRMPVGLFIPFDKAWKAIREFMERDAALPQSIAWLNETNLPKGTFPSPWAR